MATISALSTPITTTKFGFLSKVRKGPSGGLWIIDANLWPVETYKKSKFQVEVNPDNPWTQLTPKKGFDNLVFRHLTSNDLKQNLDFKWPFVEFSKANEPIQKRRRPKWQDAPPLTFPKMPRKHLTSFSSSHMIQHEFQNSPRTDDKGSIREGKVMKWFHFEVNRSSQIKKDMTKLE